MNQGLSKMHSNSVQNENDKDDNQPVEKNHHPLNFRIVRLKPDYKIFFFNFFYDCITNWNLRPATIVQRIFITGIPKTFGQEQIMPVKWE